MPINVSCQGCGKAYAVPDERAGQRFKCKACGTVVSVPGMRAPANEAERIGQLAGSIGASVVPVVMNILVIVGAHHLQNLKKFPLAMTGAIIACIPCCGPCLLLGIPFGIWAFVLLNDSRIRPHFQ